VKRAIHRRIRRTAITIPLVAAILIVTMPLSGCGLRQLAEQPAAATAQAPKPRIPSGAEKFAAASDSLTGALDEAQVAFAEGSTSATALADIRDFAEALPKLDKGVRADFAKTRKVLKRIDSPAKDAIERKVEAQYASRVKTLESHLGAITSASGEKATAAAIAKTSEWLASITPEEPYQPLGTELPHRIVDRKAGPPVLGTSIAPAYAPNTPGAEPSTLPVTPTAEDTSETIEIQFTPEIASLVASLGADPVRMYEYVRNTIDFEPYYGSRKGATETYLEGSGNDIDTASLLIALYRKAGIPARYVSGVVDVPIDEAMNWVGVEVPEAAAKLFSAGGTPTQLVISGGKPKALRIEHTWAEVYVDYEDYRGAGAGDGEKIWVPLDASFKQYRDPAPVDLDLATFDPATFVSALESGAVETSVSVTRCDLNAARDALVSAAASLTSSLQTTPGIEALLHVRRVERDAPQALPPTMPVRVINVSAEWMGAPDGVRERVSVGVPGGALLTVPLAALSSSRITVGFVGATAVDSELAAAYHTIADVPAYQVDVKPRISIDGVVVSEGDPVPLGEAVDVSITSLRPGSSDAFTSRVTAGGVYAMVLDASRVTLDRFEMHAERYGTQVEALQTIDAGGAADVDIDALVGELFHTVGLAYFMQLDAAHRALSGPWDVVSTHVFSEGMVGTSVRSTPLLGVRAQVVPVGVSIDVRRDVRVAVPGTDDPLAKAGFCLAMGGISSALEGRIMEQVFGLEGISTMRVLQIANNSGIPIITIDADSAALIETLAQPESLKAELRDAVARGEEVVIPEHEIDYFGYRGTGWIVRDPDTDAAGYMIAGGLSGGASTQKDADFDWGTMNPFAPEEAWASEDLNGPSSPSGQDALYINARMVVAALESLAVTYLASIAATSLGRLAVEVSAVAFGVFQTIRAIISTVKKFREVQLLDAQYNQQGEGDSQLAALKSEAEEQFKAYLGAHIAAVAALAWGVRKRQYAVAGAAVSLYTGVMAARQDALYQVMLDDVATSFRAGGRRP
jgi:transglutaminase-like putative cysteine protease